MSSRHISTHIDRPSADVYDFAVDPTNLPAWAQGLGASVERVEGQWIAESPMGRVRVEFAPRNPFGVLDHDVTLPTGQTVTNPLRVLPDGAGCEVVFTLRRAPGASDEDVDRDADMVAADLAALKRVLEDARPSMCTHTVEVAAEPDAVVALLSDPRHIPAWAPAFADVVEPDGAGAWRATKDGASRRLRAVVHAEAGAVDYLREIAPGREGGAYLRVIARPHGGSLVTMTVRHRPGADPEATSATLRSELAALAALLAARG